MTPFDLGDLKGLADKAAELSKDNNIDIESLLNDELIQKFTNFESVQAFLEKCPMDLKNISNLQDLDNNKMDSFVNDNTNFSNWKELLGKVTETFLSGKLKF